MRRSFVVLLVLSCIIAVLPAQTASYYLSIQAGGSLSSVNELPIPESPRFSWGAVSSISGGITLREHLFAETGFGYYQNGYRVHMKHYLDLLGTSTETSYVESDWNNRQNQLLVPLRAGYSFGGRSKLEIYGGLYFSIYLNTSQSSYNCLYIDPSEMDLINDPAIIANIGESTNKNSSRVEALKPCDFGVLGGLRYSYQWKQMDFILSAEYLQGLVSVMEDDYPVSVAQHNRSFLFQAGIRYKLQRADSGE